MKTFATRLILSLCIGLFCLAPLSVLAQESPAPLAEVWIVTPKIGQMSEFQAALKAHTDLRKSQGDPRAWQVYTAIVGDTLDRYAIRNCCVNWADLDSFDRWDKSNPDVLGDWYENVAPYVEKMEHYFSEVDWSDSNYSTDSGPFRYFRVTDWQLERGMESVFEGAKEQISQIALNQGWANAERNWLWTTQIGGSPTASVVVPHKNFASMARGDETISEFLGKHMNSREAAAELIQKFSSSTSSESTTIWEHLPDLSFPENE
jgi:hypothetical protein